MIMIIIIIIIIIIITITILLFNMIASLVSYKQCLLKLMCIHLIPSDYLETTLK